MSQDRSAPYNPSRPFPHDPYDAESYRGIVARARDENVSFEAVVLRNDVLYVLGLVARELSKAHNRRRILESQFIRVTIPCVERLDLAAIFSHERA